MRIKQIYTLVFGAFLFLSVSDAVAQFSVGAELGLPISNFSNQASPGFGASVRYEASLLDNLNWTGSAGFVSFAGKAYLGGAFGNVSVIPLVGGLKYYFGEANNGLYAAADLGLNIIHYCVAYPTRVMDSVSHSLLPVLPVLDSPPALVIAWDIGILPAGLT